MSSAVKSCLSAQRPLVSITIGVLLLLFSLSFLLAYLLLPLAPQADNTIPTPTTLVLLMAGAIYLLACLNPYPRGRAWQQRSSAIAIIAGGGVLLYWHQAGFTLENITLSAPNTLISFILLGTAALIQSVARTLTQLATIFLLILGAFSLAIFGIIALLFDYDPLFPWYGVPHMSLLGAWGVLMLSTGLAYMTWWCHRGKHYDAVSGITLLSSILLLFTMVLGSGLIYSVAATHLHFEARDDLGNLLRERTARIEALLKEAETHAAILSYEALQQEGNLWSHQFAKEFSLRITDQRGHIRQRHNADWFERKSVATIDVANRQLWRGEDGQCQLRLHEQRDGYQIEIGIALNLRPILNNPLGNDGRETLKLCAAEPGGVLRCLTPDHNGISHLPPLNQQNLMAMTTVAGGHFYVHGDTLQAAMPLPEYGLLVLMEQDQQAVFGSLHNKLSLTLPLALLLLGASVLLITWRIHPLAKALQQNEQRYRSLIIGAGDAIFMHAPSRHFIEANPAACQLLGYSQEELLGKHPDDFLLPEDQQDARLALEQSRKDRQPITSRRRLRRKDGTLVPVEIRATLLDSGEMISIVRDISEQVRHEEELQERERFTRSVVEVLAEGVVVQQADGTIIYTNRAAQQIIGQEQLVENEVPSYEQHWELFHEDGTPFPREKQPAMVAIHQGTSQRNVVMGLTRPEGNQVWLSVNSDPLWNESHDTIIGAVTSFSDISSNRQTEQRLRHSQEQLRALSNHLLQVREDEKMAIAREIHDELGSNLTAIRMVVEWLNSEIHTDNPQLRERLTHLSRITAETILTTRNLVTQLRPTLVEDMGLWAALEWLLQKTCLNYPIEVSHNLQCSHLELPEQTALTLYRVIQEALNNIIKHAKAHKIRLECWHDDDSVHITLEDDGVGIDEETSLKINSYGIRGMHERVEQLHGTIELLGTPGEGTLVVITIPYPTQRQASS